MSSGGKGRSGEDPGKIQGRSIDLWEFGVQECWTMRGNGRRMKTGEMRLWDRGRGQRDENN